MANGRYYGCTGDPYSRQGRGAGTSRFKLMLILGLGMAAFQAFKFYTNTQTNAITGEDQRVQWSTEEEVAIGLQSRSQMTQLHGGLHPDQTAREQIAGVGKRLINNSIVRRSQYPFEFHLLRDDRTVNAFASLRVRFLLQHRSIVSLIMKINWWVC